MKILAPSTWLSLAFAATAGASLAQGPATPAPVAPLPIMRQLPGMEFPFMFAIRRGREIDLSNTVLSGDVDRDGDLDIVLAPWGTRPPRLILNDGHGRMTEVTSTHMPTIPGPVVLQDALADIDGDGDLDYFAAHYVHSPSTPPVTILLNDGAGHFTDVTATAYPDWRQTHPYYSSGGCVLADFDGDGDVDAALGSSATAGNNGRSFILLRNDGTGVFTYDPTAFPPGSGGRGDANGETRIGDLDGDGDIDIVAPARQQGGALWINDGTGHFTDETTSRFHPVSGYQFLGLEIGDLDGDGDIDIVFGPGFTRVPPVLYINDGSGNFYPAPAGSVPADVVGAIQNRLFDIDEDGDLDLLCIEPPLGSVNFAGRDQLLWNDGSGRFTHDSGHLSFEPSTNGGVYDLAFGDFDGDGDIDLVCGDGAAVPWPPGHLRYFLNTTRHVWAATQPTRGQPWPVRVVGNPGAPAALAISLATARTPLPPAGTLAVDLSAGFVWPAAITIPSSREIQIPVPIPDLPALVGAPLYAQALIQEPGGPRLTNLWIADSIQ
jgi:hypothetical protein